MTSDHFTGTKFRYTKQDALVSVGRVLGGTVQSGEATVRWSTDGTNSIGVLLAYFNAFRGWLRGRTELLRRAVERAEADYPHYAKDPLWVFPFHHTELWADTTPEILASYIELLDVIGAQISQADLALVRNGLDHKRDDDAFPSSDSMLASVSRLEQVVDIVDRKRLIPKLYWGIKTGQVAHGNVCDTFEDYRGTPVSLWGPTPVLAAPGRYFATPHLIAPFDFLNEPNSALVFVDSPRTVYWEYWRNYPRRRVIPPEKNAIEGEVVANPGGEQMHAQDAQPRG